VAKYKCEDLKVEQTLKKLETRITAAGGWLNDDLVICENSGDLHLESGLEASAEELLAFIPEEMLLSLDSVHVGLADNDLSLSNPAPQVSAENYAVFQTLIELFNQTDKIKTHKTFYPWLALAEDQETIRRLIAGRPDLDFIPAFKSDLQTGNLNSMILKSFFKTRILRLAEDKHMLVPIVDCANHHFQADSFKFASQSLDIKNIGLLNSKPVPKSDQAFIRYGTFDAFDLFMNYGFGDGGADFVRSVPITLNLGGLGDILVNAHIGIENQGKLPETLAKLRFHTPIIMANEPGSIQVTHLIIPRAGNAEALKTVLAALIKALTPTVSGNDMTNVVESAISQIVTTNTGFYQDLKAYLNGRLADTKAEPVIKNAIAMTDLQLSILGEYKSL